MWEVAVYFRQGVEGDAAHYERYTRKKQALSNARSWKRNGMEVVVDGITRLVPADTIHYIEVYEVEEE